LHRTLIFSCHGFSVISASRRPTVSPDKVEGRQPHHLEPPLGAPAPAPVPHHGIVGRCLDIQHLTDAFEAEGTLLNETLRKHPQLRPLFSRDFQGVDASALKRAYLQLLKLKADYV
jgi:hypothetical protein